MLCWAGAKNKSINPSICFVLLPCYFKNPQQSQSSEYGEPKCFADGKSDNNVDDAAQDHDEVENVEGRLEEVKRPQHDHFENQLQDEQEQENLPGKEYNHLLSTQ